MSAVIGGDPDRKGIVVESLKGKLDEILPHR